MFCSNCRHWLVARVTDYENGERVFNLKSPDGKGQCERLKFETDADFGCNKFELGYEHIEIMGKKPGSPWHHKRWGGCPECGGGPPNPDGTYKEGLGVKMPGDVSCERCCRTGRVMYYDDGFVGEEKKRRHPNEPAYMPGEVTPRPTCPFCTDGIELHWKACPNCGAKLEPGAPVRVQVQDFTP